MDWTTIVISVTSVVIVSASGLRGWAMWLRSGRREIALEGEARTSGESIRSGYGVPTPIEHATSGPLELSPLREQLARHDERLKHLEDTTRSIDKKVDRLLER